MNKYGNVRAIEFANPVRLRDARDQLRKEGVGDGPLGPGTTNRYLAAVRHCWNWGRNAGLVPKDSVWPPGLMLTEPKGRKRYLTDAELSRALSAARKEEIIGGELMRAAVMFAVGVGCRQSEQLAVRWQDINEKNNTVAITVTKTDTSRRTYLPPAVCEALKALRAAGNVRPLPCAYVFVDAKGNPIKQHVLVDAWQRLRTRAGLAGVRWHDLRHRAASFLVQGGSTLAEVANQLGHRNVATTARYAHLVEGRSPPARMRSTRSWHADSTNTPKRERPPKGGLFCWRGGDGMVRLPDQTLLGVFATELLGGLAMSFEPLVLGKATAVSFFQSDTARLGLCGPAGLLGNLYFGECDDVGTHKAALCLGGKPISIPELPHGALYPDSLLNLVEDQLRALGEHPFDPSRVARSTDTAPRKA